MFSMEHIETSIVVGGRVQSIGTEFFTDRRQRVLVDGAASVRIQIISGVPQGSVLGPLLFIPYTCLSWLRNVSAG